MSISGRGAYWDSYRNNFDLYRLELGPESSTISRITRTPSLSERRPNLDSDGLLTYQSDAVGIYNLESLEESQADGFPTVSHISDLASGFLSYQQVGEHIAMSIPEDGKLQLVLAPLESLRSPYPPSPTLLRLQYEAQFETYQEELRRKEELALLEAEQAAIEALEEDITPDEAEEEEEVEEEDKTGDNTQIRYYIFDEEEDDYEAPPSTPEPQAEKDFLPEDRIISTVFGKQSPPELDDIRVGMATTARSPWKIESIGFDLQFDPISKLGPEFTLSATDLMGNHRVDFRTWPSFNLKNSETVLRYTYQKPKIDLFAEAGHRTRRIRQTGVVQSDSLIFRFDRTYADVGIRYPFLPYLDASIRAGIYRTDRKDQQLLRSDIRNAQDHLLHAGIQLTLDRVREVEGYQYKGMYGQAGI